MMKAFKLQTLEGQDVLGGAVSEDNVYIRTYGAIVEGYKSVSELEVDEVTRKVFALSGAKPTTYVVVRVA